MKYGKYKKIKIRKTKKYIKYRKQEKRKVKENKKKEIPKLTFYRLAHKYKKIKCKISYFFQILEFLLLILNLLL